MMPPLLAIAVALSALGLLVMLSAAVFMPNHLTARWPTRLFDSGYAIFCLALTFWLVVSLIAFFAEARMHGG
ncbi:MAG: hypothetical protein WBL20_14290 [Sphingobium sp.]|uniref:hypothetical protein n=1 Tax=Sphingobium sp. TaxID=1912891 RepID=UPI002E1F0E5F